MFKLWLEWDLGRDSVIFSSYQKAERWADMAIQKDDTLSSDFRDFADIQANGLGYIEQLQIDP